MQVAFWPSIAGDEIATRLRAIPAAKITMVENLEQLAAVAPEMEALVIGGHFFKAEAAQIMRSRAKKLRFIQTFTAGYEGLQEHGVPRGSLSQTRATAGRLRWPSTAWRYCSRW